MDSSTKSGSTGAGILQQPSASLPTNERDAATEQASQDGRIALTLDGALAEPSFNDTQWDASQGRAVYSLKVMDKALHGLVGVTDILNKDEECVRDRKCHGGQVSYTGLNDFYRSTLADAQEALLNNLCVLMDDLRTMAAEGKL